MCKCCQYCLESIWWNCCEERYCWDDSIVLYEDDGWDDKNGTMGIENKGANIENGVVSNQPMQNNNHLQDQMYATTHRDVLKELPIMAPNLYQVFSKSMIFRDDSKDKPSWDDEPCAGKSTDKKTGHYNENITKVVTFNDKDKETETKKDGQKEDNLTDFQIMFQDELYKEEKSPADHGIFKIEEEDEDEQSKTTVVPDSKKTMPDDFEGVVLRNDSKTATPVDIILQEATPEKAKDPSRDNTSKTEDNLMNVLKKLPKATSAQFLPRSESSRSFVRTNSRQDLLRRVESMKEIESENLKHVLARLPETSVPFLAVPNIIDGSEINRFSGDISTIQIGSDQNISRHSLISQMPDTPVIKGSKLPKFFAETPNIGEYKPETSLQSLKTSDIILTEFDYSMPRYYGKHIIYPKPPEPLHASKSMPDLNIVGKEKVNKRLVKLRGRLKPLVIKKHTGENSKKHLDTQKF